MKLLFLSALAILSLCSCGGSGWSGEKKAGYRVKAFRYRAAEPDETTVRISLWDQKAWLLNAEGEPILMTDISTGVPGKETPEGTFPILERLEQKRSNRYGRYVDKESREVVVEKSWEHEGAPPEGTEYEGISMPYWMRLSWDGVGMHVGEFKKRARASFGCVRVCEGAQKKIFEKTQLGTEIEVVAESLQSNYEL